MKIEIFFLLLMEKEQCFRPVEANCKTYQCQMRNFMLVVWGARCCLIMARMLESNVCNMCVGLLMKQIDYLCFKYESGRRDLVGIITQEIGVDR